LSCLIVKFPFLSTWTKQFHLESFNLIYIIATCNQSNNKRISDVSPSKALIANGISETNAKQLRHKAMMDHLSRK